MTDYKVHIDGVWAANTYTELKVGEELSGFLGQDVTPDHDGGEPLVRIKITRIVRGGYYARLLKR